MTSSMSTVLVFGGTGGIGESCARRFHRMGKKVIITGRRSRRLGELASEMPGLETYTMDNSDLAALPGHVQTLIAKYPDVDTVWVNSGVLYQGDLKALAHFSDDEIVREITTNLTAPIMLARHFMPHLLSLPRRATFMVTSSGLAFVPSGAFPVYCSTKAGVHSFLVGLRQTLADTNVDVIELTPPYVRTDLDAENRLDNVQTPMELDDFTEQTFEILDNQPAHQIKEVAVGRATTAAQAWRKAMDPILQTRGGG